MRSLSVLSLVPALPVILFFPAGAVTAAEFDVPAAFATLQAAVAAAEVSGVVENNINITDPVIFTGAEVLLDGDFSATRHLTIRPDPDATFDRATIAASAGCDPIFRMVGTGFITLQDLDIIRTTTNCNHLIVITYEGGQNNSITIERCRIGSIWSTSTPGWDYLKVEACYDMIVRNCIFFSRFPGLFARGIEVSLFTDPANSIRLYNNVVADAKLSGIVMHGITTGTVLLRNNVVSNHPDAPAGMEPTAYRSGIGAGPEVISSHNVAFASAGLHEDFILGGFQSIAGVTNQFILQPRADIDFAFVERTWDTSLPWLPNADFWRLEPDGTLHDDSPDDWGMNVSEVFPDVAVRDDIERDFRPGGAVLHTDRGADQIEPGLAAGVASRPGDGVLKASLARNPSEDLRITWETDESGTLVIEVFDVSGRHLHRSTRPVSSGEGGDFRWAPEDRSGIVFYRLKLVTADGRTRSLEGRSVLTR